MHNYLIDRHKHCTMKGWHAMWLHIPREIPILMRVLNESSPSGPVIECTLPGKTLTWLPFAGGISAFAVILPKPLGTGDRVVDGYPDASHLNRWLRSLEAVSPDLQKWAPH
jgi:hypothetical protein